MSKEKVIILYKDNTVKLKSIDNFLPSRRKLNKIKYILIPLQDRIYPVYISVIPDDLMYCKRFILRYSISIETFDMDECESCIIPTEISLDHEFNNYISFVQSLHIIYKLIGFNAFSQDAGELAGYYEEMYTSLLSMEYLEIEIYDNNNSKVYAFSEYSTPVLWDEIFTNGLIINLSNIDKEISKRFIHTDKSYENVIIDIDKMAWSINTIARSSFDGVKYDYQNIIFLSIMYFDAYYLLSADQYNSLQDIDRIYISLEAVYAYEYMNQDYIDKDLLNEEIKSLFSNKSVLLEMHKDSNLEIYKEYFIDIYNPASFVTIAFLSEIMEYTIFKFKIDEDIDVKVVAFIEKQHTSDHSNIYIIDDTYSPNILNAILTTINSKGE